MRVINEECQNTIRLVKTGETAVNIFFKQLNAAPSLNTGLAATWALQNITLYSNHYSFESI